MTIEGLTSLIEAQSKEIAAQTKEIDDLKIKISTTPYPRDPNVPNDLPS
jgi:hypothetical protein